MSITIVYDHMDDNYTYTHGIIRLHAVCAVLQVCWLVMAGWGGVMGWDDWSARHTEKEFVLPQRSRMRANPIAQKENEMGFVGSIWSWVSGRKRREEEEELKCAHEDPERRRQRYVFNHSGIMLG